MFQVEFDKNNGVWIATETRKGFSFTFEMAKVAFQGRLDTGVLIKALHGATISDDLISSMKGSDMRDLGLVCSSKPKGSWRLAQLMSDGSIEFEDHSGKQKSRGRTRGRTERREV